MSMRYVHPVISLVDAPRAHAASTSRIRLTAAIVAMIVLAFGILTTAANPANATTTDYVYWTNVNSNAIGRANIDGTAPDQNFITGANAPDGVTATSTHIYWTNVNNGTIGRANIDGTGTNQNFITGANGPVGVATAPVTPEPTPVPGTTTVPANGCVTAGSATSIPRTGTKRLMKPKCVTNSGAQIGVKASAQRRGDMRTYTLFCKTTNGKTSKTSATGNAGTRYCKKGALNIRTYGVKLNLRITWKAPVVGDYAAYTKVKSYRT